MKTAVNKIGLISILLILIVPVIVTAEPLPSAPIITKEDVKDVGGNVVISWKAGTNYFKNTSSGTQIDNFDSLWDYSQPGGAQTIGTAHYQEGSGSIALNFTGNGATIIKDLSTADLNLEKGDGFSMWVYIQDADRERLKMALKFISANNTLGQDLATGKCDVCFTARLGSDYLVNGWNRVNFAKSDFNISGTETWGNKIDKVQISIDPLNSSSTNTTTMYFDDLRFNAQGKPVAILNFDDGLLSTIGNAAPIMNYNGQRGIVYPIKDYVNTHGGYMLIWDLNYLKRNGWDISSHANHADLLNLNNSQIQDNLTSSRQWLIDNGFNPDFLAYPYNGFNDNIVSITKDEGYVMARTVVNGTFEDSPSLKNGDALLRLKAIEVKKGTTIDDLKALIDHTKSTNSTIQFIFHEVISTPVSDYDVSTTVFQAFSDYLKSTGIAVVTYSDYWNIITSVQPDSYIVEVNGVQKPETTDLSSTVSYSECTATKLYAKNSTYGTTSAPISIAPYCPNAVLVTGIEDKGNYNESVTIILTPASPSVEIRYNLKNVTKVIAMNENYTAPIQVEYEGNYTLEASGQMYNFTIDKTKPITTVIGVAEGQNYYTPKGVTISFNSIDNLSGVMTTIYHLDEETNYSTYDGTGIIRTFVGNHILTYKTYDKAMNMVEGTVNFTISNPPTPPSGGGGGSSSSSSSGGGGGVSMGSGEDPKNIAKFESRDGFLKAGIDTTFLFTTLNQGIYQIFLNGESEELGVRVENLRGKQNGTIDAPDNVLLYTNVMVSSARIKDLSFTFKIDKNNITKLENVKAFVWNNGTWNQLDTKIVSAGGNNAYFQSASTPAKLTKLAISEIKAPDSASQSTMYSSPMQAQKLGPSGNTTEIVPANDQPKAPGFGIFAAILAMAILYVKLKK